MGVLRDEILALNSDDPMNGRFLEPTNLEAPDIEFGISSNFDNIKVRVRRMVNVTANNDDRSTSFIFCL